MSDTKKFDFCPITQKKCRDDCAWYHIFTNLTEEGVDRDTYCAITVIANALLDVGEPVDWDEW